MTTRKKSARKKANSAPRSRQPNRVLASIRSELTLERKFDIAGVVSVLVGVLSLLALFSSSAGIAGNWIVFLAAWLGWGVYLFPILMIILGGWLVTRNIESIPDLSVERMIGFGLLFSNILVWMQFLASPGANDSATLIANSGGGGYIGGLLFIMLNNGLGVWGTLVALFGWFVIASALTLDVSVLSLFGWLPPLLQRIQAAWQARRAVERGLTDPLPSLPSLSGKPPTETQNTSPHSEVLTAKAQAQQAEITAGEQTVVPGLPGVEGDPKGSQEIVYVLPAIDKIMDEGSKVRVSDEHDVARGQIIEETLASFGAPVRIVEINRGPTITQFGVEPAFIETRNGRTRVRVSKISALADDLALALAAASIRIEAPVPGKGFVGIEVPNEEIASVALRAVIESKAFKKNKSPLKFALGQDVSGNAVIADLASMPHLLIAGSTGSGKSVCVNALINCLLLNNTPDTLRFIMIDPKRVELTGYNGIPHLMAPVVVELERVVGVLQWVTREMDGRYQKFSDIGARNLKDYNKKIEAEGRQPLHNLVVVIDELADLMMVAPDQSERLITRMAQLARATGIHLVISTQRPSVDVVTGLIKANIPARISFAVASGMDSRVILDQSGAERLLGRGDMLFQAPDAPAPTRLQGVYVSDPEIARLVQYWHGFAGTTKMAPVATSTRPIDAPPTGIPLKQLGFDEMDEQEPKDKLYDEALDLIRRQGRASISMLQRRLRIGYTRSARIIELMEEEGIIGPAQTGAQTRQVLDYGQASPPVGER